VPPAEIDGPRHFSLQQRAAKGSRRALALKFVQCGNLYVALHKNRFIMQLLGI